MFTTLWISVKRVTTCYINQHSPVITSTYKIVSIQRLVYFDLMFLILFQVIVVIKKSDS